MSDGRDPAIKLFGREIPLKEEQTPMEEGDAAYSAPEMEPPSEEEEKDTCQGKSNIEVAESILGAPLETAKAAEEAQPEQDHSGEDKLLKKPDKVLPCPRCNSTDTKFCYYNNYNVNQPRHFCKNCQRYWTAGGSMRNVPVGAGRRKNKHTASAHRHTSITPDAFPSVQVDCSDSIDRRPPSPFNCNATILQFGTDAPLCESMASILNIGEQNSTSQLDFTSETSCSSACKPEENGFPESTQQDSMSNGDGVSPLPHLQYFPGPPWWINFAPVQENGSLTQMPPLITPPAFCHSPLPFPFVPPPFWGWACAPLLHLPCSGNVSPTLGKHSREEEEKTEKSLWIPKTLRVDDPDEAAKSSIFATLGIKPYEVAKFKAFSSKSGDGNGDASYTTTTQVLHANPAALSRSRSFQEITS